MECSTINIDEYEQFPPLGKEEYTSTHAKSFSVPSVDPDTTINYSDISDPVLRATIASFVQSCHTESNSIESEHVMESVIDSESTSHVSEEAPIDSFVQWSETESDCHQSDHVMVFHLYSDSKSKVSSDLDGSFQEQNVSDMDITNLSMEVMHPFKNPSKNCVTTSLSVDKLYELASTQTPIYTYIPLGSNKMYVLLLTTRTTGSVAFRYLSGKHVWQDV